MSRFFVMLIGMVMFGITSLPVHAGGDRVALVIGNAAYNKVNKLDNPLRDSRDIAQLLKRMKYQVTHLENLDRAAMRKALVKFGKIVRSAEIAVLYFAGHGIEMNGKNWLLPVDARLAADIDVEDEALGLDYIMNKLQDAKKLGLIILDACRNNPYANQMTRSARVTRSVQAGLAGVEPDGNVLLAYAARHGTEALDGTGEGNSPYAAALKKHLGTPDIDVRLMFGKVRDEVILSTVRTQAPHIYGSLGGSRILLNITGKTISPARSAPPGVSGTGHVSSRLNRPNAHQCSLFYQEAVGQRKLESLQDFIRKCPTHRMVKEAEKLAVAMADSRNCQRCVQTKSIQDCQYYIVAHPQGACISVAKDIMMQVLAGTRAVRRAPLGEPDAAIPPAAPETRRPPAIKTTRQPAKKKVRKLQPVPEKREISCQKLWVARNSIFKRRGYCFKTQRAKAYFGNRGCRTRNPRLSSSERRRVKAILRKERRKGCR